jgi:xylan 1,4-beta-xylosidase
MLFRNGFSKRAQTGALALLYSFSLWAASPYSASAKSDENSTDRSAIKTETVVIDTDKKAERFPHFWEHIFGSGRAILSLRESYRQDLKTCIQNFDIRYVRFHAIFHDEVGIYDETADGKPVYNFSYVDQIYDGLLAQNVRPFIELSFMPKKLASKEQLHAFWYKQNVAPPKDMKKWQDLISAFANHLVERYGIGEVSNWYFEVWNEPNIDFWGGEPKEATYYELYDATARALKNVNPLLKVGGPATAQAAWIDRFIEYCEKNKTPVDFVTTHVYGDDSAKDVLGENRTIGRDEMVAAAMKKVHAQVKQSAKPELPIIWSEYNASYANYPEVTDSEMMAPWIANHIKLSAGLADEIAYWTFCDVFEEQGVFKKPFYGGFGLIAPDGIPKASFNAFNLLKRLGDKRLPVEPETAPVLATQKDDGWLILAVWNYAGEKSEGKARRFKFKIKDAKAYDQGTCHTINREHGSSYRNWQAMGSPTYPTREQIEKLRADSKPLTEFVSAKDLEIQLQPNELRVILFFKKS